MSYTRSMFTLLLLCALGVPAESQAMQPTGEPEATALARQAVALQQSGDYAAAAGAYRALLRIEPNEVATHVNLGIVLVKLNRFDEALAEYKAADRLLPGDPRIALNTALLYSKTGQVQEAAARLTDLRKAQPENRQVTMLLADCRLQLGDNSGVIQLLEPLVSGDGGDLGVAYMLGLALLRTGQIEKGQVLLDRILRQGDTAESHFLLGARMFESGDYPSAVRELGAAVKINPQLRGLQSLYGQALLITGDPGGASDAFQRELATNLNDFDANAGLGSILTSRGQHGAAIPMLERALTMRPDSPAVQLALAQSLAHAGRFRQALPYAQSAVTSNPQTPDAHDALATVYAGLKQTVNATHERGVAERLRRKSEPAPHVGDLAPDFSLLNAVTGQVVASGEFRGHSPVVLVLGSYSCPNLRTSAPSLLAAYRRYKLQIPFLLIYIREAHSQSEWQSTRNEREGITVTEAASLQERSKNAAACARSLHFPFPAVTDTMNGRTETAYNAWPSRAFLIDKTGRITYSTRLTELDFRPDEFDRAMRTLAR